jgi:hypothetical protein
MVLSYLKVAAHETFSCALENIQFTEGKPLVVGHFICVPKRRMKSNFLSSSMSILSEAR